MRIKNDETKIGIAAAIVTLVAILIYEWLQSLNT